MNFPACNVYGRSIAFWMAVILHISSSLYIIYNHRNIPMLRAVGHL